MRQLLANKVSGCLIGIWLLIPELLRLGAWDLLKGWCGSSTASVQPRLALQMVNEAALCTRGLRQQRCLSQKGFELANGLPFVAADTQLHHLLEAHTVADGQALQVALGQIRQASGHYQNRVLAFDPHRLPSTSKRQMVRQRPKPDQPAVKNLQSFFCLDAQTEQPLCATLGSSSITITNATERLLQLTEQVLPTDHAPVLILADGEHFTRDLIEAFARHPRFDLLVPMPRQTHYVELQQSLPADAFTSHWAGYATACVPFCFKGSEIPLWHLVQRLGEPPAECSYRSFLSTTAHDQLAALTEHYPDRWHIEEFFNRYQHMGWRTAGTLNQHIRYNRLCLALVAQAASHQLRQRLGSPFNSWQADHLSHELFRGIDGDLQVQGDRILVTCYNAPHAGILQPHFQHLPDILKNEGIEPRIPWLYDFKLDFRFK